MTRKPLFWQIYRSYLLLILVAVLAAAWYGVRTLKDSYWQEVESDIQARTRIFAQYAVGLLGKEPDFVLLDRACKDMGRTTATRFTIILPDGRVVSDSDGEPSAMDNHADRPEIREALKGRVGTSTRFSDTIRQYMTYCAVPMEVDGRIVGVARASFARKTIEQHMGLLVGRIAIGSMVTAVLAAIFGWFITRRIARPIEEMRHTADRFANGDLRHRIPPSETVELNGLAETLNNMAEQLDDRIRSVIRERNQRETVFAGMMEGVIAVDTEQSIIAINAAAGRMLGFDISNAAGRSFQEVVRNSDLESFVNRTLQNAGLVEGELLLHGAHEVFAQVHGAVLRNESGTPAGAVIVLNDITRLKRLENMRRDFVGNVSHELKTPITSVKGAVETLLDGAMNDPEEAKRFLDIIARHSNRLSSLIDDLLTLSRIEYEAERQQIALDRGSVRDVANSAAAVCEPRASAKGMAITVDSAEGVFARMNRQLLEQAIVNLIDNAIKYSNEGSVVSVAVRRDARDIVLQVQDKGCGIDARHLSRLFERFYRVDMARSRKLGGTGLGLAIVKHIIQAHGGSVGVESEPGKGSTFSIRIPAVD